MSFGRGSGGPGETGGFDDMSGPNPLWESVRYVPVDPNFVFYFFGSNKDFVEDEDIDKAKKHAISFSKYTLLSTIGGIVLNTQLKRVVPEGFFRQNFIVRGLVRIPLFFVPFALVAKPITNILNSVFEIEYKYRKRLVKFQRTGDMKALIPPSKLAQFTRGP